MNTVCTIQWRWSQDLKTWKSVLYRKGTIATLLLIIFGNIIPTQYEYYIASHLFPAKETRRFLNNNRHSWVRSQGTKTPKPRLRRMPSLMQCNINPHTKNFMYNFFVKPIIRGEDNYHIIKWGTLLNLIPIQKI